MVYTDQAWARRRCTAAGSSPCAIGLLQAPWEEPAVLRA
jgi:hypothetical protein